MQQTFFLGGISANGFRSRFSEQIHAKGVYTYILKGGPGTGKSTLMKQIAAAFPEERVSLYYCASDPRSLDAVYLEDRGIIVVDGTAPHVFEATYPLISQELLNLGAFLDKAALQSHADAVLTCFQDNAQQHQRARQYAQAITAIHDDLDAIGSHALLRGKLNGFASRLARRMLPRATGTVGLCTYAQLSALTAQGYLTHPLPEGYRVVLIRDTLFAASGMLLQSLAAAAMARGINCVLSECFLTNDNVPEHLLLPDQQLAFLTANPCTNLQPEADVVINCTRFYDKELLTRKRQRVAFDRKASRTLTEEAAAAIATALRIHDTLESYYVHALDFTAVNAATAQLLEDIKAH